MATKPVNLCSSSRTHRLSSGKSSSELHMHAMVCAYSHTNKYLKIRNKEIRKHRGQTWRERRKKRTKNGRKRGEGLSLEGWGATYHSVPRGHLKLVTIKGQQAWPSEAQFWAQDTVSKSCYHILQWEPSVLGANTVMTSYLQKVASGNPVGALGLSHSTSKVSRRTGSYLHPAPV